MPRNLVICCDGTTNEFGVSPTNVVRLTHLLDQADPAKQLVFYDSGVGTMPAPGVRAKTKHKLDCLAGKLLGAGIHAKLTVVYRFLMHHYEEGDRIYLFGYSRGAYTVRALAGVLHQFGLLRPHHHHLVDHVMRRAHGVNKIKHERDRRAYFKLSAKFRGLFGRRIGKSHRPPIHFLGLWDTVSSVGSLWEPTHFPNTARNKSVVHVRHALALDERRRNFDTNLWQDGATKGGSVQQMWFAGCHGDVGGGGDDDPHNALWWQPFAWMVREACAQGLELEQGAWLQMVRRRQRRTGNTGLKNPRPVLWPSWRHPINESLKGMVFRIAELPPRLRKQKAPLKSRFTRWLSKFAWGKKMASGETARLTYDRSRTVPSGTLVHRSVLRRLRTPALDYHPKNLDPGFVRRVREDTWIPDEFLTHP